MSTEQLKNEQKISFSLRELTEIIIKHKGLHEGLYNMSIGFNIGFGAVGQTQESMFPGAMIGISKIGIVQVDKKNIHTVDAAEVNPLPKE
jgi:hypothetical protein